jgi:phosphoadenosine phosphosulfate reductase
MATVLDLDLLVVKNTEAIQRIKFAQNKDECCFLLKAKPLNDAIMVNRFEVLLSAIRRDEQEARGNEEDFAQRLEPAHVRIHPVLHFGEDEIWAFIRQFNIPYCELYDQGYRSLGCQPCTKKTSPLIQGERSSRGQDKERIMKRLRPLGYF